MAKLPIVPPKCSLMLIAVTYYQKKSRLTRTCIAIILDGVELKWEGNPHITVQNKEPNVVSI